MPTVLAKAIASSSVGHEFSGSPFLLIILYINRLYCFLNYWSIGALGETRTHTLHPLKVVRLPISPPGRERKVTLKLLLIWCLAPNFRLRGEQTATSYRSAIKSAQHFKMAIGMYPTCIVGGNKTTGIYIGKINNIQAAVTG